MPPKQPGINRNIVECKVKILLSYHKRTGVLIETLWNVKFAPCVFTSGSRLGINRNIVECKVVLNFCFATRKTRINRNIVECKVSTVRVGNVQIIRY